jgi:hypothetical protein
MGKIAIRKFGVKQILGDYREISCKECGERAGLHYGNELVCPRDKHPEQRKEEKS